MYHFARYVNFVEIKAYTILQNIKYFLRLSSKSVNTKLLNTVMHIGMNMLLSSFFFVRIAKNLTVLQVLKHLKRMSAQYNFIEIL